MLHRSKTRKVKVGSITIGGENKVVIQSMSNTKTKDVDATVSQILKLEKLGCQLIRVACFDQADARAIQQIKKQIHIPIAADIHFDYRLALIAIEGGVDKIRINPGNIGSEKNLRAVVNACKEKQIPIRIGVNSGSIEQSILNEYGYPCAEAMVASAKHHVAILEAMNFHDIIISLKASNMRLSIEAYELAAKTFPYPLHLGITEAGTFLAGTVKSAAGLGVLLNEGIGNTIRVSLADDPAEEIKVCKELLKNFNLASNIPTLIACPTCGRIQYDMIPIAKEIEAFLETIKSDITVAIMGCAVNGPGEAKHADIAIAGGASEGLLIKKGKIIKKVKQAEMVETLKAEILAMIK